MKNQSVERLAAAIMVRDAAVRLAAMGQATFWLEVDFVRNQSVKDYEDSNHGDSGISGDFFLKGTLHVQPKGAVWSAQFPVHHRVNVNEHPASGTYAFSPEGKDPTARLLGMALMESDVEDTVRKGLGRLEFIHYGKTALDSAPVVIVGDVFYSSWGYDQTNVDYYQVIKTTPVMIQMRQVAKKVTKGLGTPSEYVIPLVNQFTGPVLRKKLLTYNGRAMVSLNSYSRAYKWDGREKAQTGSGYGH